MRYLLLLLSLTFAPALFAQGVDTIHDLRLQASNRAAEGNLDEAFELQRDAVLIARGQGRPELQAECMIELWHLDFSNKVEHRDRPAKTLAHARRLAVMTGRLDLEATCLWYSDDSEISDRNLLDIAIVLGDFTTLEQLWLDLSTEEESSEVAGNAIKVADLMAEARLLANGKDGAKRLATAAEQISELGFTMCSLALLEEALASDDSFIEVLQPIYQERNDIRGLTLATIINAPTSPNDEQYAQIVADLEQAFQTANELRNSALQIRAARKLRKVTGDDYWAGAIRLIEQAALFDLIADGRRALRDSFFDSPDLVTRLEVHRDNDEIRRILDLLTGDTQSDEDRRAFQDSFRKAITTGDADTLRWAVTVAEIADRHEAFPVAVEALKPKAGNPFELAGAIEILATADDLATLIKLLAHEDPQVAEAAAAALFRLGVEGFEDSIRAEIKRLNDSDSAHRIYLIGALASLGDESALESIVEATTSEDISTAVFADSVLANLGYAGPMARLIDTITDNNDSLPVLRALGRMPNSWGQSDATAWNEGTGNYQAARVWGLRGISVRAKFTNWKNPFALIWALPRPKRDRAYDNFRFNDEVPKMKDRRTRKMLEWGLENSGTHSNSTNAPPPEEGSEEESPLDELTRIERETRKHRHGENERRLVLVDWASAAEHARCEIHAKTGAAVMTNSTLIEIPFQWEFKTDVWAGGILGRLYRDVILRIAETDLLHKLELNLPGYDPIVATGGLRSGDWDMLKAELPLILGEGLDGDRPLPLETVLQGKLRVTFNFNGNYGEVDFPIRVDVPPDTEKPDLVPLGLTLDPAVPDIDDTARIFLRVKNNGKSVERDAISSVRFQVHNPQDEGGWSALDAQVFVANGWRAGEIRTFEVRPKFVEGHFMNSFSYTYMPALGDSKLVAIVDPDNAIEELDEDNNMIELEVPLRRSREEGLALAETELLAALNQPTADFMSADTIESLDEAFDVVIGLVDRLKERTPVIRRMVNNLSAVYWFRRAQLRSSATLNELEQARADGSLTVTKAARLRGQLLRSQREVIRSGIPFRIETIEKARNVTLAASGVSTSLGDKDTLMYAANRTDTGDSAAGDASQTLLALDAAVLFYLEAQRAHEQGRVDMGNMMDAISNSADALDLKLPGFGNFQREIFRAELEYAEQGLRKEADAIAALGDVIEGKEGAQERLVAAAAEVEKHIKDGPFNKDSLKDIAKGWVKDIPVIGPLADMIFSWK